MPQNCILRVSVLRHHSKHEADYPHALRLARSGNRKYDFIEASYVGCEAAMIYISLRKSTIIPTSHYPLSKMAAPLGFHKGSIRRTRFDIVREFDSCEPEIM